MRLTFTAGSKKRQGENPRDRGAHVVVDHFDAKIGARIAGAPGLKKLAELRRIARQRTMRLAGEAPLDVSKRAVQPYADPVIGNQLEIFIGQKSSSTERNHVRASGFHDSNPVPQRGCFELAEGGLAMGLENFRDGGFRARFNVLVEINESPAELIGQRAADGGFAASHEPDQINSRRPLQFQYHRAVASNNGSMQQGLLPLFPLQVVLLPGAELPLHIFEDRYKQMIGEVIRDRLEFGVVLANEKGIVNTGCTATVDRVLRQYPDGRMDIVTRGRRRFEIMLLNDERAFLRGAVEFFDDDEESRPAAPDVQKRAIEGYNQLQALSSNDPLDTSGAHIAQLSFRLAQPVPDVTFRQILLATRSEAERLKQIAEFMPGFVVRQRRIQHVKEIAPRNGHGQGIHGVE